MTKLVSKNTDKNDFPEKQDNFNNIEKASVAGLSFLINDLNSINIERTYSILKSKIRLVKNVGKLDPDVLSRAIDEAPEWAFKASQLLIIAKEKLSKFEDITFKIKTAELYEEASQSLEEIKRKGKLSGQITKEKIENWIILHKPEYKELLQEKRELKMAVEAFESLSKQFESRKTLLQSQGRLAERRRFIVSSGDGGEEDE